MSRRRKKEDPAAEVEREIHLVEPARSAAEAAVIPVFEELPVFEEEDLDSTPTDPVAREALDESSVPGEQFRLLGARVRALAQDRRLRRIGVVSAAQGEGKTTVSLGLARALAVDGHNRVLLAELDLRRPAIDRALALSSPEVGLRQYLEGDAGGTLTLRRPEAAGFWILSAGEGALTRPEALTSSRMVSLLKAAERVFDYTVIDCPPLLPVADAVVFQDHIDGFVLVVRARHSPRETVERAADLIKPERICGMVMNDQRDILPSYREYANRRYGDGTGGK
jgi:capsular exopolysaccharide synthesis family protein